jgi:hypothetical protein
MLQEINTEVRILTALELEKTENNIYRRNVDLKNNSFWFCRPIAIKVINP